MEFWRFQELTVVAMASDFFILYGIEKVAMDLSQNGPKKKRKEEAAMG